MGKKKTSDLGVLPLVVVEQVADGGYLALVEGHAMTPHPFPQDELGQVVSDLVATIGGATRVEIHDAQGVHVDIIQPPPPSEAVPEPAPPTAEEGAAATSTLVEFSSGGFAPGEEVGLAPVITGATADESGQMRMVVDYRHFHVNTREVLLYGYMSGTTHLMGLPSSAVQNPAVL